MDTSGNTSTSGVAYTYDGERAAVSVQKSGAEITTTYIIETRTVIYYTHLLKILLAINGLKISSMPILHYVIKKTLTNNSH